VALKITVPESSKRYAFNICPPEHDGYKEVLYHFNPRRCGGTCAVYLLSHAGRFGRGDLLENDREGGRWGRVDKCELHTLTYRLLKCASVCRHPLDQMPVVLFDRTLEVQICIGSDGFHTYIDGQHVTTFFHRCTP
jgi:hypothetical protein